MPSFWNFQNYRKIATSWDNWDAIFIMKNCEFHQFRDGRGCHDSGSSHHVPLMFMAFQGTPLMSNASTSTSETASDDTGTSAAVIGSTFSMSLFQIQNDLMARHANKNNETTFAERRFSPWLSDGSLKGFPRATLKFEQWSSQISNYQTSLPLAATYLPTIKGSPTSWSSKQPTYTLLSESTSVAS